MDSMKKYEHNLVVKNTNLRKMKEICMRTIQEQDAKLLLTSINFQISIFKLGNIHLLQFTLYQ